MHSNFEKILLFSESCGALFGMEDVCELAWNEVPVFKTGRRDCNPDPSLERPFFTKNHEIHPNLHGNGPTIVDWYKNHFGLTGMAIRVVDFSNRRYKIKNIYV